MKVLMTLTLRNFLWTSNFTGNISEDIDVTLHALHFLVTLDDPFPNNEIAYRVIIGVPVMVATVKQVFFSKLDLVKNYFPKKGAQECLGSLVISYIKKKAASKIQ